jgi:hypothetical protein
MTRFRGWRRVGRPVPAWFSPSPSEVAELVDVLDDADSRYPGGADLSHLALAVLEAGYRKQQRGDAP